MNAGSSNHLSINTTGKNDSAKLAVSHKILFITNSVIDKLAMQMTLTQLRLKHLLHIVISPYHALTLLTDITEESELFTSKEVNVKDSSFGLIMIDSDSYGML